MLHVADSDGIRTITIDRPEAKNALTAAMRARFCELCSEAEQDPSVRVVIIAAVDPVFSAGVDFRERPAATRDAGTRDAGTGDSNRFVVNPGSALRAVTKPSICAVNGACVSGALELALSATFIVASERARFADTHARLGVVPAWGLSALLPRAVGVRKAAELSITGNFVGADEALRLGLVNHVVPHEELGAFVQALAHEVADTGAVREMLDLYRRADGLSVDEALALEADHVAHRVFDAEAFRALGEQTAARGRRAP